MGGQHALAVAKLTINAVLLVPAICFLVGHGKSGFLGWLYLSILCVLQITGNAIYLSNPSSPGGTIISSICLSPLLLAILGVLNEALRVAFSCVLHLLIATAIGLVAAGAADAASQNPKPSSQSLVKIGIIIILAAWFIIFVWALSAAPSAYSTPVRMNTKSTVERASQNQRKDKFLSAILLALVIAAIRVIYTVVLVFAHSGDLDPLSQSLAVEACLNALPEMVVVILLEAIGFVLLKDRRKTQ
ncbi:hypothetical protein ACLMJK_002223 [Lecanora helva]